MSPAERERPIHWGLLFAAFAVSVMLWLIVLGQNSRSGILTLDVQPTGLDASRLFLREAPRRVLVNVRGTPQQIEALTAQNAVAYVDLTRAVPGRGQYPVKVTPESLRALLDDVPETVTVTLEEVVTKTLPITIDTTGKVADESFVLDGLAAEPREAVVRGPRSEVAKIEKVRAILELDRLVAGRTEPYEATLEALTGRNQAMEYVRTEPLSARVTATLSPAPEEKPFFVRPTIVGAPAAGFSAVSYGVEPRSVMAMGRSLDLAQLSQIATEPVDISGISSTRTFEVALRTPPRIRTNPASVRITVRVQAQQLPDGPPPAPAPSPDPAGTGGTTAR